MSTQIAPFLMFQGQAEEAINFYTSTFANSEIITIQRYGPEDPDAEGTVMHATFSLKGQVFHCIDSSIDHGFTFTPAISFSVACDTKEEIDRLFEKLSDGGTVFMPLDEYPFSPRYAWVGDKFGVTWQLSLGQLG